MKKKPKKKIAIQRMSPEEAKQAMEFFGMIMGIGSRAMLKFAGHEVDYKVNGEDIASLKSLNAPDINKRIELAIREERFEDAAKLRDIKIKNESDGGVAHGKRK